MRFLIGIKIVILASGMNMNAPVHLPEHHQNRAADQLSQLTAALDGCRIDNATRAWTVAIHGVYPDGDHWFLQLCDAAHPGVDLVVRVSPEATVQDILAALRRWTPPSELSMTMLAVQ
jgi:hypothetical protein